MYTVKTWNKITGEYQELQFSSKSKAESVFGRMRRGAEAIPGIMMNMVVKLEHFGEIVKKAVPFSPSRRMRIIQYKA